MHEELSPPPGDSYKNIFEGWFRFLYPRYRGVYRGRGWGGITPSVGLLYTYQTSISFQSPDVQ